MSEGRLADTLRAPRERWGDARCVVLADGEHYPAVVRDAMARLVGEGWKIAGVVLLGGTEKLRDGEVSFGAPLVTLDEALAASPPWFVDVSDEPVSVLERRLEIIALAAANGISYAGPDNIVRAPARLTPHTPTLAVLGTGKRIGKTAVGAHIARLAQAAVGETIVVAMGRGGPAEPVVIDRMSGPMDVARLLEISRAGHHAASDYLEDAALAGVTTIGCRRAGGGVVGTPVESNVLDGMALAEARSPQLIVLEGSGSVTPPVRGHATVLLASDRRPQDLVAGTSAFRTADADVVLYLTHEPSSAPAEAHGVRVVPIDLVPTPTTDMAGRRVAVFTTAATEFAAPIAGAIDRAGAQLALVSHQLASRDELHTDVTRALELGVDAFAVELKAAAIDVVAEAADAAGIEVVLLDNRPVAHDRSVDLDALLTDLAYTALERA